MPSIPAYQPSLSGLLANLNEINNGLMELVKDESFIPTRRDLYLLRQINKRYHHGFALTYYVERRLSHRLKQKWEAAGGKNGAPFPSFDELNDPSLPEYPEE